MRVPSVVWKILNHSWFLVFAIVLLTSVYTTKSDRAFGWTKAHKEDKRPIFNDGAGYYAWMPKWFLYNNEPVDFSFLHQIQKEYPKNGFQGNVLYTDGDPFNKYYTGTAVAMTPFFGVGHMLAGINNVPQDGYSWPYQLMAVLSGVFYFFIGMVFIAMLLRRFEIDRFWIIVCLCLLAFGSNMGFYIYEYTPYSHVYSFAFCSLFLLLAKIWADKGKSAHLLLMAFTLGIIFLIRPTNVLIIAIIPFLFPTLSEFTGRVKSVFKTQILALIAAVLIFGLLFFFQLYSNHSQTGIWALNTYENEKFDFLLNPKVGEVLFGFRKGLFIYSPALLLFIPGLVSVYRNNRLLFWGILLQFAVFTYVISSWWCWWYGGGLGMRPYLDILVIFIVPIAFLLQYSKMWARILTVIVVVITCKLGLIFEYQARNTIMHYDSMNYEKYKRIFMHTEDRYGWAAHLEYDTLPLNARKEGRRLLFNNRFKPLLPGKSILVNSYNLEETIFLNYIPHKKNGNFGAKVSAEVFLFTERTNPTFKLYYYKNGEVFHENTYFFGSFIPELNEFTKVNLDVYQKIKFKDFDSVYVSLDKHIDSVMVKNAYFQPYFIPEK